MMPSPTQDVFELDARLAADTHVVTDLPLSRVLLMNDSRYAWLIVVPRRPRLVEIADLSDPDQATLWREVNQAACALRRTAPCDKLNLGALGNVVSQLHVHVVARNEGDAAWPGPVWGHGCATPYAADVAAQWIQRLRLALISERETSPSL